MILQVSEVQRYIQLCLQRPDYSQVNAISGDNAQVVLDEVWKVCRYVRHVSCRNLLKTCLRLSTLSPCRSHPPMFSSSSIEPSYVNYRSSYLSHTTYSPQRLSSRALCAAAQTKSQLEPSPISLWGLFEDQGSHSNVSGAISWRPRKRRPR